MQINFYHLTALPLEKGLPRLLEKVHQAGMKSLVLVKDEARLEQLNQTLWSYTTKYFLPHGTKADGFAEKQPIYLTIDFENPANANVLAMIDGATPPSLDGFEKAIYMFDGEDAAQVQNARTRWKDYKDAGHELVYWKQTPKGKWEKAA